MPCVLLMTVILAFKYLLWLETSRTKPLERHDYLISFHGMLWFHLQNLTDVIYAHHLHWCLIAQSSNSAYNFNWLRTKFFYILSIVTRVKLIMKGTLKEKTCLVYGFFVWSFELILITNWSPLWGNSIRMSILSWEYFMQDPKYYLL